MAREQEEGEQRKSSVDRVNDFIQKAQDVQKNIQRLQKLQKGIQTLRGGAQAAQGAASAAEGAAAAAGAVEGAAAGGAAAVGGGIGLGGVIVIILLIIIIPAIIIVILMNGQGAGTCYQISGAVCEPVFTNCPTGTIEDSSQSCNIANGTGSSALICCVPEADCAKAQGTCEKGPTTCSSSTEMPNPTAKCTDPATPLCCTPESGSDESIVYWAQQIVNALQPYYPVCTGWTLPMYNTQQKLITNAKGESARQEPGTPCGTTGGTYFCTYLIADAYRLAGILTYNLDSDVPDMIDQFNGANGGIKGFNINMYVTYASLSELKAGDVIFWTTKQYQLNTGLHVTVVSDVSHLRCVNTGMEAGCVGYITILEANDMVTQENLDVTGNVIRNPLIDGNTNLPMYPVFGYNGL